MQNLRFPRINVTTRRGKTIFIVATSAALLLTVLAVVLSLGTVFGPQRSGYPYQASKPGVHCGSAPGVWQDWTNSTSACVSNGALIHASSPGRTYAQEMFYGPSGTKFPADYRFSVQIGDGRSGGCKGAQYELSKDSTALHYGAALCADGSWNVGVYNNAGKQVGQFLRQGDYAQADVNTLTITYNRGVQTILIDGNQVARFTNKQAQTSDFIGLGVFNAAGNPEALFRQFKIDALA